jgi:hypothetical protein
MPLRDSRDCVDREDPRWGLGQGDCTCIRYPVHEYGEGVISRFRSETGNHAGQKRFASFPALTTDPLLTFLVTRYDSTGFPFLNRKNRRHELAQRQTHRLPAPLIDP